MKRYIFLTLVFTSFVFLNSCENKNSSTIDATNFQNSISYQTSNLTLHDFDYIGESHNNCLDSIYNLYFANSFNYSISYYNSLDQILCISINYVQNQNPLTQNNFILDTALMSNTITNIINSTNSTFLNNISNRITVSQYQILQDMFIIIDTSSSYSNMYNELENLGNFVKLNLNNDEQIYMLMTLNVAQHSLIYWTSQNGQKWLDKRNELLGINQGNNQGVTLKGAIETDAKGFCAALVGGLATPAEIATAISGAIDGFLASGFNPIGALAGAISATLGKYGSAAISAGIAASAMYLIWS